MGKGGTVLGLIGILIGASGLSFGVIAWSIINTETNLNNSWYEQDDGPYTITPPFTVVEIPNFNVTFELSGPASVYLSFTCQATTIATSGYSTAFFYFGIDGVLLNSPSKRVGTFLGGSTNDIYSVSLQHLIEDMAAGSHIITIRVSTDYTGNFLTYMTLYVHTFAP